MTRFRNCYGEQQIQYYTLTSCLTSLLGSIKAEPSGVSADGTEVDDRFMSQQEQYGSQSQAKLDRQRGAVNEYYTSKRIASDIPSWKFMGLAPSLQRVRGGSRATLSCTEAGRGAAHRRTWTAFHVPTIMLYCCAQQNVNRDAIRVGHESLTQDSNVN